MTVRNHQLMYRPLVGGIGIMNPSVNEMGTLGFIATSDGVDRFIVSCFHVLGSATDAAALDGAPVHQPTRASGPPVARVRITRADHGLDCAAAEVEPGVGCAPAILGLGPVGGALPPTVGMAVVKSGLATGITEGVIDAIDGTRVRIKARPGFPSSYELSAGGDSGAVWLLQSSLEPVALHRGGTDFGQEIAEAVDVTAVLAALQLQVVAGR